MDNINNNIQLLEKKYKRSWRLNVSLSVMIFSLTAALIILNLFAIRFNPAKALTGITLPELESQQVLFLIITIITTITTFVGGILHLFVFKKKAKQEADKIKRIKIEIQKHLQKVGRYEDDKRRDETLVDRTTEILNM